MNKPLSGSERARRARVRKRSLGYVQIGPWVHRDDKEKLMAYAAELNAARGNVVTQK